ncbi:HPP family protein [Solimonas variicoloris]|uniref:HPP family protein n=1 Tax=Solimonas variicoloris TaxID=254408 RepID=UPI00038242DF|nr:HPP family protein [Solimonas variicoloris]
MNSPRFSLPWLLHWLGVEQSPVSHAERLLSALGGFVAIAAVLGLGRDLDAGAQMLIVASMGASAVLLFGVPHGALSQPWPVFGGHLVSALAGVSCQRWLHDPLLASAAAVGLALGAMHYLRCLHPPGGATALTAVIGGPSVHALGYDYLLHPVLLNVVVMLAVAVLFNALFRWRRYPVAWVRARPAPARNYLSLQPVDLAHALKEIDSFIDVDPDDLERIVALAEVHASARRAQTRWPRTAAAPPATNESQQRENRRA